MNNSSRKAIWSKLKNQDKKEMMSALWNIPQSHVDTGGYTYDLFDSNEKKEINKMLDMRKSR